MPVINPNEINIHLTIYAKKCNYNSFERLCIPIPSWFDLSDKQKLENDKHNIELCFACEQRGWGSIPILWTGDEDYRKYSIGCGNFRKLIDDNRCIHFS